MEIIFYVCTVLLHILKVVSTLKCECGVAPDTGLSMRIVGGRRALPHSFPWTVAIQKANNMHCGGALITDRHILSAGHCFKWDDFKAMTVYLGLDNLDKLADVTVRSIVYVKIHEDFTSTAVRDDNDIAIATLNQTVAFSDRIVPICLPKPNEDFSGYSGTIVGWGRMGVNLAASKVLLKASLKILTPEECYSSQLRSHLTSSMMCAYSKGKDGCQGDSGGPLLVMHNGRYVQAGVVSWGIGCADPRYPGVYTKVSNYVYWIQKNIVGGYTCSN